LFIDLENREKLHVMRFKNYKKRWRPSMFS
jgi:hypothetical protein